VMPVIISSKKFEAKDESIRKVILESLDILDHLGVFFEDLTPRRLEMMAMSFLAVCDVNQPGQWSNAKTLSQGYALRSRDIIDYINGHFGEAVSKGSYDDIRRKHLKRPVDAGIIEHSIPESSRNDPTRSYALSDEYATIVRSYGSSAWADTAKHFIERKGTQQEAYHQVHNIPIVPITIPGRATLNFSPGPHNKLQKEIVEIFLPHFGFGSEIWYLGDTADKYIIYEKDKLKAIGFFDLDHAELPDVIAYSKDKNLLYLIEAFHSTGCMSIDRYTNLKNLTAECTANRVYITAFSTFDEYKKHAKEIAWETEVWIAEIPTHMIHFNGPKFLSVLE